MLTEQIINAQIDLLQHQRRRIALLVDPDDKGIAHRHVGLMQQPVGQIVTIALFGKCHVADKNFPLRIPAYQQLRSINLQAGQTKFSSEQRHPRDTDINAFQHQCGLPLLIQYAHIGKIQVRQQSLPITLYFADGDRIAHRACQRSSDPVMILLDIRQ